MLIYYRLPNQEIWLDCAYFCITLRCKGTHQEDSNSVWAGSEQTLTPRALPEVQQHSRSWARAGHPWEPPAAPRAGPSLQRDTLALAESCHTFRMEQNEKQTPQPKENSLLSELNWNLGRIYQYSTSGTSANFPCVISMSGLWSSCTHTLLTGILQLQENPHLVFTRKPSTDPL